jgi:hypothetical protein
MTRWIDSDGDCQDARQEVLIQESRTEVVLSENGCRVVSGEWHDPYTGIIFTDPGDLDIDHYVPLQEAFVSGANAWTGEKKGNYANDLQYKDTLIAVSLSANRSKGSRDPSEWMPPNDDYHCEYLITWVAVKDRFELTMDDKEITFIKNKYSECTNNE